MLGFMIGLIVSALVCNTITKKYLPGQEEHNDFKFFAYSSAISIPSAFIILAILEYAKLT